MLVFLGLIILVAAVVVGVAGVLGNAGSAHALTHTFTVLGYHVTGSTGTLYLYGIIVGAAGLLGLSLLFAGARRSARHGRAARRGLKESRRQTATVGRERDALIDERETALADRPEPVQASSPSATGRPSPESKSKSGRSWRR
jgi:hypothetical protein